MGLGAKLMNIFHPNKDPTTISTKLVDILTSTFTSIQNENNNVTYASAVNTHGRNFSKIQYKVYSKSKEDDSRESLYINYLLNVKPNPITTAPDFYENLAKIYFQGNLVLIFIEYDYKMTTPCPIKALWLVDYLSSSFQVKELNGKIYYQFSVNNKNMMATDDEVILLTREADVSNIFGKKNNALVQTLQVINTQYQGVEKAVKMSAFVRFLLTSTTPLSDAQKKERAKTFADAFLDINNSTGIAFADSVTQAVKIDAPPKYSNADEIQVFKNDVYEYLTITPPIIKGDFTENQWQSYYEAAMEPLVNKLAVKLTDKLFTQKDIIYHKKEIRGISSKLQTASFNTRILIANALLKMPVVKPNQITNLLYLPDLENGEKEYSTLNYTEADKLNQYQLGMGKEENYESENEEEKS